MKPNHLLSIIILLVLLLIPFMVLAKGSYVIEDIAVEGKGANATIARKQAINSGQEIALYQLLDKLTENTDFPYYPTLSPEKIAQLVKSYTIESEKISQQHYQAVVTYAFNPAAIRKLLEASLVEYDEQNIQSVLFIPILVQPSGKALWGYENEWYQAWKAARTQPGGVRFILPNKARVDSELINATQLIKEEYDTVDIDLLEKMALRYGVGEVFILIARPVYSLMESLELAANRVEVKVIRMQLPGAGSIDKPKFFGRRTELQANYVTSGQDDPLAHVFHSSAEEMNRRILNMRLSDKDVVAHASANSAIVAIYQSLKEWLSLRKKLERADFIDKVRIDYITSESAKLKITYNDAGVLSLEELLKQEGFTVIADEQYETTIVALP